MPTSTQVIDLIKQLSVEQQTEVLRFLLLQHWTSWVSLSQYGQDKVRQATELRGYNWNKMTELEREDFITEITHEAS